MTDTTINDLLNAKLDAEKAQHAAAAVTEAYYEAVRAAAAAKVSVSQLARELGITRMTVYKILDGRSWKAKVGA